MSDDFSAGGGEGLIEAKVKWYNGRKGFGFVLGPDGQDVFFHASALTDSGIDQPDTDDILVCEIGTDREILEADYPDIPFLWLDTEGSEGEVFWLSAEDLGVTDSL